MWTSDFYRYGHIHSYKRQEFQNILERKLEEMKSLWAVNTYFAKKKKLIWRIEHDVLI